ncbi:unnamed protein product [Adineta ricciae]|nr:unnamed protein product [Adineta ricciae]
MLVAVILLLSTSTSAHPPSTYENSFPYEISSETDPQGQIIVPVPPGGINKWLQQLIATMGPVSDERMRRGWGSGRRRRSANKNHE